MKKFLFIFVFAFVLVGIFSFSSMGEKSDVTVNAVVPEIHSESGMETTSRNEYILTIEKNVRSCTVEVRGEINGTPVRITITASTCRRALRAAARAIDAINER